ncbi:MAG: VanW family protein [Dysgonomonas sp.]|nr:VanW family protein [Dysgonomonas sp.]
MLKNQVEKPIHRGAIRKKVGTEFFILKRKLYWILNRSKYARQGTSGTSRDAFTLITHKSMLLRPLKDVDMYLQHNKITNLRLAIEKLNGTIIKPGKTFSIWKQVGRPSKRKGYLEGLVLHNGQILKGTGGGLCQLGNLLFWMALHTDLEVTERWRHSFDVFPDINRKIPFGCGATLSYNYIDLQLRNNTDKTFELLLWLDDEYLNGKIVCDKDIAYTFKVIETDHMIKQQWWGGYTRHNRIWKHKLDADNNLISKELVAENHAVMMYNPLLTSN